MHYRKNSIRGFTEAKALAVPGTFLWVKPSPPPHLDDIALKYIWWFPGSLYKTPFSLDEDQLPGHCKGYQIWKPSAADDQVPTPFQLCKFCVFSSNLFSKRNKLCDSHLPYPATTAALSPQTLSDSTTSSLHSEDGSHFSGTHNEIRCLLNMHWPSPNQNASFSTNLRSGSWNISTVSSFMLFL